MGNEGVGKKGRVIMGGGKKGELWGGKGGLWMMKRGSVKGGKSGRVKGGRVIGRKIGEG